MTCGSACNASCPRQLEALGIENSSNGSASSSPEFKPAGAPKIPPSAWDSSYFAEENRSPRVIASDARMRHGYGFSLPQPVALS
jgi:hypothetical protein